ncbi:ATP cone domain-containing protein, partial [Novipirellula maiorica]
MSETTSATANPTPTFKVRKRDGREVEMDRRRIESAIAKAFRAELNLADQQPLGSEIDQDVLAIIEQVFKFAEANAKSRCLSVEQIQDVVEIGLMQREHFRVARRYILYRTEHARLRAVRHVDSGLDELTIENSSTIPQLRLQIEPGVHIPFSESKLKTFLESIPESTLPNIETSEIVAEVIRGSFDGMTPEDIARALVLSARSRIERSLDYDRFAAAMQLAIVYRQTLG